MGDSFWEEVEAQLEILLQRGEAYRRFVGDVPPLLWEMAMLAQAGWTVLPRVDHPDLDRNFPEARIEMQELECGPNHRCFIIGGPHFQIMPVERPGYLVMIPELSEPVFLFYWESIPPAVSYYETHVYRPRRWALTVRGRCVWQAEIYVREGSIAASQ